MLENDTRASRARRLSLVVVAAMGMLAAIAGQTRPSALAGQAAAGRQAAAPGQSVVYSSVGPVLTIWDLDVDAATLTKRDTRDASRIHDGGDPSPFEEDHLHRLGQIPGGFQIHSQPHEHGMSAFRIDPATGALTPHGPSVIPGEHTGIHQRRRHRHSREARPGV